VLLENDAVIDTIKASAKSDKFLPGIALLSEFGNIVSGLYEFVLKKAEENEAVERSLGLFQ